MANESFGKAGEHLEWPANSSFIQNQSSESCFWQMTAAFRLKTNLAIWPKRFTTLAVTPVRTIEATPDKSGDLNRSMQHFSKSISSGQSKLKSSARVDLSGTLPWLV